MSPVIEKTNNLIEQLITSQILVGLDIGYKTIGIAVSDRSFTIATPLNTVSRKGNKKDLPKIKEFLSEYNIGGFILGLPFSLNGNENEQTGKIRKFSIELQSFFLKPIEFWDERYSSD
ncbi:Holliday junction resolvase RuvX, partial [Pelagibacterales bacterium SAG-MED31]|nr:Holliday junction resolvase RuvX [Pelagibacterales bacterium SAG-MED31]